MNEVAAQLAGAGLDYLINNAGIATTAPLEYIPMATSIDCPPPTNGLLLVPILQSVGTMKIQMTATNRLPN